MGAAASANVAAPSFCERRKPYRMLLSRPMRLPRSGKFWAACAGGWLLLSLVEAITIHLDASRAGRQSALDMLLTERLLADSVWVIVAAIVLASARQAMLSGMSITAITLRLAVLGLALTPLYAGSDALAYAMVRSTEIGGMLKRFRATSMTSIVWDIFTYAMLSLGCCASLLYQRTVRNERESAELRARLAQTELDLLRTQLEPHFLFNALNTIAGLIREQRQELATGALAQLSELLRYVVEASRQERVPLAWELQFATSYLQLQQLRYGTRLRYVIREDRTARSCDVPPLLLQPLIENAVIHGASRTSDPATIEVRASVVQSELRLEVRNTGSSTAPIENCRRGIGLSNTRQRLERIYGDTFRLTAGPDGAERYRVAICLPQASCA